MASYVDLDCFPIAKIVADGVYTLAQRRRQNADCLVLLDGAGVTTAKLPTGGGRSVRDDWSSITVWDLAGGSHNLVAPPAGSVPLATGITSAGTMAAANAQTSDAGLNTTWDDTHANVVNIWRLANGNYSGILRTNRDVGAEASWSVTIPVVVDLTSRRMKILGFNPADNGNNFTTGTKAQGMGGTGLAVYAGVSQLGSATMLARIGSRLGVTYSRRALIGDPFNQVCRDFELDPDVGNFVGGNSDAINKVVDYFTVSPEPPLSLQGVHDGGGQVRGPVAGGVNWNATNYRAGIGAMTFEENGAGVWWGSDGFYDLAGQAIQLRYLDPAVSIQNLAFGSAQRVGAQAGFEGCKFLYGVMPRSIGAGGYLRWAAWSYTKTIGSPDYPAVAAGAPDYFASSFLMTDTRDGSAFQGNEVLYRLLPPRGPTPGQVFQFDPTAVFDRDTSPVAIWIASSGIPYSVWRSVNGGLWLAASGINLGFIPSPLANWAKFVDPSRS